MNFEVETKYTLDEYKKFNQVVLDIIYSGRKRKIIIIIVCMLTIVGLVAFKMYSSAVIAFIVYAALFYLEKKGNNKAINDAWESNELMKNAVYHYKFSEDKVEATSPKGLEILEYDKMYRLIETDTNFYMMIAKNVGFIILKANMTKEQIEFVRGLEKK